MSEDNDQGKSIYNGALFAARSGVLRTVLRTWWKEACIVLLLIGAIASISHALALSQRAKALEAAIANQKETFERIIRGKDIERAEMEKEYLERLAKARGKYLDIKKGYLRRVENRAKWNPPPNIVRSAKRYKALGYDVILHCCEEAP